MFLSLSKIIIPIILFFLLLYFPYINYDGIDISPDFGLIIIVLIALNSSRRSATLAGFFIGLFQDLLTQHLTLGFLSLLGTCFGYSIGNIRFFKNTHMLYLSISFSIFIYFFMNFIIQYSEGYFFYFKFTLIKMFTTIISLILLKFFFTFLKLIKR